MLVLVYALIGILAAASAITLLGFNTDLAISGLLFDPAGGWLANRIPTLRDHGFVAVITCIACILLSWTRYLPGRWPALPGRTATALALALLLGPGLLVNVILKEHWGRPRPVQVTQFNGTQQFVNWWSPRGSCERNCSFISGEASTAAWMFGPAMLVPPPWRAAAIAAAAAFTALISFGRMASGAHFFSDVLIGALTTMLILLALRALSDRWTARRNAGP